MPTKLKLPPGIVSNGTDYAGAGQWIDCNLMRWEQQILKTIGGWTARRTLPGTTITQLAADPTTEAARSALCIAGLASGVFTFFGTNKKIYLVPTSGSPSDVTPVAFVAQAKDATQIGGYGTNLYGISTYGTPRPATDATPTNVFSWGFAGWGEVALACARNLTGDRLYKKAVADARFTPIATSPLGCIDMTVTDERIVMAVGTAADNRLVSWSDREDYTQWTPAITNMAGTYRLAGTGRLVAIKRIQNQLLIIGENDAFSAQFIGPPYIYGFNRVGDRCGAESSLAVASAHSFTMWYGQQTFWIYDGSVRAIACPVLEYFLADMNPQQSSKITAFVHPDYDEVWWLYQSNDATECNKYIAYNYKDNLWYIGTINRTCAISDAALNYMTAVGNDLVIYNHEIPNAGYSGATPYITSGPLETDSGGRLLGMAYVFPDDTATGDIGMDVQIRDLPKNPPLATMSYDLASPTSTVGVLGRDLRLKFYSSSPNEQWSLGDLRVEPVKGVTGRR